MDCINSDCANYMDDAHIAACESSSWTEEHCTDSLRGAWNCFMECDLSAAAGSMADDYDAGQDDHHHHDDNHHHDDHHHDNHDDHHHDAPHHDCVEFTEDMGVCHFDVHYCNGWCEHEH